MVFICKENFKDDTTYSEYINKFEFDLSNFQKYAIESIVTGNHCLITAHTGSGKTLPAEFAIEYFVSMGKKVIYTGPIKALCNQKLWDFKRKFPNISFGVLTGDIKDNPDADCLIMTTEILRNTLLSKEINKKNNDEKIVLNFDIDIENELAAVVFDEVHYIGDSERGCVWEQTIILLPPQVQLIMLSATIEKPEIFAKWIEDEKNKNNNLNKKLYLIPTNHRVVPLNHYAWLSLQDSVIKASKGTEQEHKFKEICNKPIPLATSGGIFNETNYHKINKMNSYFWKNKIIIKRNYVLNSLIQYLKNNNMLPAICFVFSRKNVENFAKEINVNLFEKDEKTPSIIEDECKKIIMNKIPNYKDYLLLDEYHSIISLLKKGIAIHHAGILPLFREMVEMLFEKKYIKILFATETFAVGINMPTKTVIFTQLEKFTGQGNRALLPHEYTQMAGRAGRRGLDKIGYVIHCNNLIQNLDLQSYSKMITGPPKMLSSQFKISYNLIINILQANKGNEIKEINTLLIDFMEKSFIKNDIIKEINQYDIEQKSLEDKLNIVNEQFKTLKTNISTLNEYKSLKNNISNAVNKQKKTIQRKINDIENQNITIQNDFKIMMSKDKILSEIEDNNSFKQNAINYIQANIESICSILEKFNFVKDKVPSTKGIVAMHLCEINSLSVAELYENTNGFIDYDEYDLIGLFSCFTNISIPSDKCSSIPYDTNINPKCKKICKMINDYMSEYYDEEIYYQIDTGTDYNIHFELIDYIITWAKSNDELSCFNVIQEVKNDKEIFTGEFIKAILKINNIANEFEKICEYLSNFELMQKIKKIPELTLKYIATNQSLYI